MLPVLLEVRSFRWTCGHNVQLITSLSSRPLPDENSVCVCHRLFVIFRLFQAECEQYDLDACRPLKAQGACVPLRICYNLMIERWNEAVKAGGISCSTLGLKA